MFALLQTTALAEPVHISVPSINTDASVVAAEDVPDDPDTVVWYSLGPDVGYPGNAIFLGHVDWDGSLRTFGLLKQIAVDDTIFITDTQGEVFRYTVEWVKLYDADGPLDMIYAQSKAQEITLITCGGVFNRTTHSYESRWVARAIRQPE